jgi:transcriptional regulator with XRE-family HTH domain
MRTLRALREAAGLTERQLANKMQVRADRIPEWELGRRALTRQEIGLFALAVGVTPPSVLTAIDLLAVQGGD